MPAAKTRSSRNQKPKPTRLIPGRPGTGADGAGRRQLCLEVESKWGAATFRGRASGSSRTQADREDASTASKIAVARPNGELICFGDSGTSTFFPAQPSIAARGRLTSNDIGATPCCDPAGIGDRYHAQPEWPASSAHNRPMCLTAEEQLNKRNSTL
jgi:hypothetical protein